ncbi:MAG: elongation factor G [Deltaproteobacteria bacterium]|nr:elongation factor G [Deltaproteobacteria bacterium]MCB9487718.1 elongation factor G [Deltaproteobacteria bacterium]
MKVVDPTKIRNVAVVGHGATGKTSLTEALLFNMGVISRQGRVEDGNTVSDFEQEEREKGYSISTGLAYGDWEKHRINLLDSPGGANFITEAHFAMAVCDAMVMVVDASAGVEVQTEKLWRLAEDKGIPRAFFVNKMDKERADFDQAVDDIRSSFSINPIVLDLPIGKEDAFEGVVDVLERQAYGFDAQGNRIPRDVPDNMKARMEEMRTQAIEAIAENDENLTERYIAGEELGHEELFEILEHTVAQGLAYPVVCGSATKNMGVKALLGMIVEAFPNPTEHVTIKGKKPGSDEDDHRECKADAPFSAVIFKTNSSFPGTLSVFRVLSGELSADSTVFNATRGTNERLGHFLKVCGKNTEAIDKAVLGDIVGVPKLKDSHTGDTLCAPNAPIVYDIIKLPTHVISFAIHPSGINEEDKIVTSLMKLHEDDPTFAVSKHPETHEIIIAGMGTGHIQTVMEKLEHRFKITAKLTTPRVPYRETITGATESRYRHKKQSGGHGQFGECTITLSPLPRGGAYEFVDKIVGGVISKTFIPAVDKGIHEAMVKGPLAGFPVVDVKVELIDGKMHDVDSSEQAFKIAGAMAFKQGVLDARPVLLEPIQRLEIVVPEANTGDIMGDLSSRRGQVEGYEVRGKNTVIRALVPLSEVLRYEPDLRSMTSGRGVYHSKFDHYQEVPPDLARRIIDQAQQAAAEG